MGQGKQSDLSQAKSLKNRVEKKVTVELLEGKSWWGSRGKEEGSL